MICKCMINVFSIYLKLKQNTSILYHTNDNIIYIYNSSYYSVLIILISYSYNTYLRMSHYSHSIYLIDERSCPMY